MAAKELTAEERSNIKAEYLKLADEYLDSVFDMRVSDSLDIWRKMTNILPMDIIIEFSKKLSDDHEDEYFELVDEMEDKVFDEMSKLEDEEDED